MVYIDINYSKYNLNLILYVCCKDAIWVPSPSCKWTQAQKAQYNEFVESGLENWALMNQTASKVDSDDKEMKIDWFNLKKIVLGIIWGDQFLYIDSQAWLQVQFLIATVFLFFYFDPHLLGPSSYFIPHLPSHLYPPRGQ